MALNKQDEARIRDYLLGRLSDEDQQQIEERLMVEDALFEEFEISKGELIEEYRAGELQNQENSWFESHYLASPEGRQRLTFAVALSCVKQPVPPQQLTWFQRFLSAIKQPRWALATGIPVAAMAAIVLMMSFVQFYRSTPTTFTVSLEASESTRSTSNSKYHRITLTPDIDEVKFDLVLPPSIPPVSKYQVELIDRSGSRKTLNIVSDDTRAVSVVIPASNLPVGLYALKLSAINASDGEERVGEYLLERVK